MKKLLVCCLYIMLQMNISAVKAGTVGITGAWEFNGYMSMYDPSFGYVGSSAFTGYLDFSGAASEINSTETFFGESWLMHDISITDNGDGTYYSQMLFDWSDQINIPVEFLFDIEYFIDENEMGALLVRTLDGNGDGIRGLPMTSGPFEGISITLDTNPVPVPAAVWLFGSGLFSLMGFARRR